MFYKRAGHAEISENLIYSKTISLFENVLIFWEMGKTPKLDVESFSSLLVVCWVLFVSFRILSIIHSFFYLLSRRVLDRKLSLFFSFAKPHEA